MKLIGLSGTNGAGKDTVGEILANNFGFLFISMTDMLREEAVARGLETTRDILRTISAEWRREYGLGVLVDKSIEHYNKMSKDNEYTGLVVASLRNPGENDRIHELGGEVIWVDADPEIRFDRIKKRLRADDPTTYEQFLKDEQSEMHHSGDAATLSMESVKSKADKIFLNESSTSEELSNHIKSEIL